MATVISTSIPEDHILQKGPVVSHTEDTAGKIAPVEPRPIVEETEAPVQVSEGTGKVESLTAAKEDILPPHEDDKIPDTAPVVSENETSSPEETKQVAVETPAMGNAEIQPKTELLIDTETPVKPVIPVESEAPIDTESAAESEAPVKTEIPGETDATTETEVPVETAEKSITEATTTSTEKKKPETKSDKVAGEVAPLATEEPATAKPFTHVETVALVVHKPKDDFKLETIFLDEVRDDEVLIDMKYSGICHTDIVLQQGLLPMVEFPAIFGHEGAGYILSIGSKVKNKDLKVGDAVLLSFNTCGTCKPCLDHHPAYCINHPEVNHNAVRISDRTTPASLPNGQSVRSQYFGQSSFAKKSIVNEKCVVKCPYPEKMDIYAPIGCGFQTGAGTVLNVLKPSADDSLVIFGLGSVGLATLMAAKYIGCGRIIAVDIVAEKLDMAKQLGATDLINSRTTPDVVAEIKKLTGRGATQAVDCTGVLKVIEDMIDSIGPLGTAVTVGVPPPGAKIRIDPLQFMLDNKKYIGVIEGDSNPIEFIPKLMEMHQSGNFPIELLCKTYPVEKLQEAMHDMHVGKVIKPVISWG